MSYPSADFDEDFDGTVNHDEFKKGLEHLGVKLTDDKFDMLLNLVGAFPLPTHSIDGSISVFDMFDR